MIRCVFFFKQKSAYERGMSDWSSDVCSSDLAKAREVSPDLIIMDIQLPHVSGLELIGQMKADPALKPVPIMAVTAYAGKGDEEQIRAAGAEAYVSKPISVIKFIESVGV